MNAPMKKTLTILEVEERVSKKTQNKYRVAQCIVHGEKKRVGELMIFDSKVECSEGEFIAEFEVDVNYERQVSAQLLRLIPVTPAIKAAMAPAKGA